MGDAREDAFAVESRDEDVVDVDGVCGDHGVIWRCGEVGRVPLLVSHDSSRWTKSAPWDTAIARALDRPDRR